MTSKQRVVLGAVRDAQLAHHGGSVSVGQVAVVCSGPWRGRGELVAQALWLLNAQGLTLRDRGATHGWKLTAVGRAKLAPRRGPARERRVVGRQASSGGGATATGQRATHAT